MSCASSCGSLSQTELQEVRTRSSSALVTAELSSLYSLEPIAYSHLEEPCGTHEFPALYLFSPAVQGWDCYQAERIDLIDSEFRSPCLCKPKPPVHWMAALLQGCYVGIALVCTVFATGAALDSSTFGKRHVYSRGPLPSSAPTSVNGSSGRGASATHPLTEPRVIRQRYATCWSGQGGRNSQGRLQGRLLLRAQTVTDAQIPPAAKDPLPCSRPLTSYWRCLLLALTDY